MTTTHVERRYAQAERALRAMQPDPFTADGLRRLRSPEYQALARRKADQMTRITRRAQRMIAIARGQDG